MFNTFGGNADAFHTFVDALVELNDMYIWFRNHVTSVGNTLYDTRIDAVKMYSPAASVSKTAALKASIETAMAPIDRGTTLVDDISTIYKLVVEQLFNNAADEFTLSLTHGKMNLTVWQLGPYSQDYRADLDANATIDTLHSLAQSHLHKKGSLDGFDQSVKSSWAILQTLRNIGEHCGTTSDAISDQHTASIRILECSSRTYVE